MSLSNIVGHIQFLFSMVVLIMNLIFFWILIEKIPQNERLWDVFIIYWVFSITTSIIFYIRTETDPKYRREV
jgi:hypothetical protein